MLKRCWQARWYLLLGLITFIITMALTTPLHFVWRYIEPQLQGLPIKVSQVSGSIWQGRMQMRITPLPVLGEINGRWQLDFWPLFLGKAQLELTLEGQDIQLLLPMTLSGEQLTIKRADGFLEISSLNPLLKQNNGSAEGEVELQQLSSEINWREQQVKTLSGRLSYSGGDISLLVDGKPVRAEMPALIGWLSMQEERAIIDVLTTEDEELLQGYLQPDGWAGISLKRRFLDVIGQEWPAKAEADTVIFEVSQKVM